jgi:hypothetical protein
MKIKTSDVKLFAKVASGINTGTIIPVHSFIFLDNGKMTKANEHQYITYSCEFDGSCLVDEKILFNYAAHTKADEISIKVSGKTVTLSDGTRPVKSPTDDPVNFQQPLVPTGAPYNIPEDVIRAIGTAAKFTEDGDTTPLKGHVFVGNKTVSATDLHIAYRHEFSDDLPEIVLSRGEAIFIGSMTSCLFSESNNWHFFQDGPVTCGWIKSQAPFFDLVKGFVDTPKSFDIRRDELMGFLAHATTSSVGKSVVGSFTGVSGHLNFWVKDNSYDIDIEQQFPYEGPDIEQFGFGPALFLRLVKAFPAETYSFCSGPNLYYLKSGNVSTLIMKML